MTTQSASLKLCDQLIAEPFAWPGGYARYALMDDCACLCRRCAKTERESIATTTGRDGWCVIGLGIVDGSEEEETCCHCGKELS